MDMVSQSLSAVLGNDYHVIPDAPLFDAHSEWDEAGNIVRRFDEKRLQAICDFNNRRAEEKGNLATFGPGHTITDAPETEQPPVWALGANWKVKPWGKNRVPTIHADMYVKATVEDNKGRKMNGLDAVRSMPHRSIELWTIDSDGKRIPGYIDHVSLQRQTPKRDLGFLAFSKGQTVTIPAKDKFYSSPAKTHALAAAERGGKLFYSMECPMDPTLPSDSLAPDQAFIEKLKQALMSLSPQFAAMLQPPPAPPTPPQDAPMDAPGGDLPAPGGLDAPGGDAPMPDDDKPLPYSKGNARSMENRLAYLEKQNAALNASLAAVKAEKEQERLNFSKADAETLADVLERDGFIFDREEEVSHFSKLPVGEPRQKRVNYLRRVLKTGHGSDLPPSGFIPTAEPMRDISEDENRKVIQYMKASNCNYEEALLKFKKA